MGATLALHATKIMRGHPCFDEAAHERVGRIHLPVAPRCNIRCRYCERRICAHLVGQHPGWARELLSPEQALARVRAIVGSHSREGAPAAFVIGVAGPGEPLANAATFATLGLVQEAFPQLVKCVSTNGLLLEESLPRLLTAGVRALTVTVNASDAEVGERVYAWIRHRGRLSRGREAAEILLAHQLRGIHAALEAGLAVKVNAVLIPGLNDEHLPVLARRLAELGVRLMNIMPLIPAGALAGRRPPTCQELRRARDACEVYLAQFRRCEQCRADVVRYPRPRRS